MIKAFSRLQGTAVQSRLVWLTVLVASYAVLDWWSFLYPFRQLNISPWNPLAALSVFVLWRINVSYAVLFMVARALSDLWLRDHGTRLLETIACDAIIICGYVVMAQILRRFVSLRHMPPSVRDVTKITLITGVGTALTSLFFVLSLSASDLLATVDLLEGWRRRFVGDFVGIMTLLPLLIWLEQTFNNGRLRWTWPNPVHFVQLAVGCLLIYAIIGLPIFDEFRSFYLLFIPMIWVAVRDGYVGASFAVLICQLVLMTAIRSFDVMPGTAVTAIQILTISLTLTAIFLGSVVSERSRIESQLLDSQAELTRASRRSASTELAAAIAHEINQPLTAIVNYASVCRTVVEDHGDRALLLHGLQHISEQSNRAGEIIKGLRKLVRGERPVMRPEHLNDIIRESVGLLKGIVRKNNVEIRYQFNGVSDIILCDRVQIQQVFYNIIRNSVEAMHDAGSNPAQIHLVVQAATEDGQRLVQIKDTGPGVPESSLQTLFDAFQTSKDYGMGLGLVVSRTIIHAHGGQIWCENSPSGAVFNILLPVVEAKSDVS